MKKALTKPDVFAALETAAWPVLLINGAGTIARANEAALGLFGPIIEEEVAVLSQIWSPENSSTAEQFLAANQRSASPVGPIKLRLKEGGARSFLVSVCSFSHGKRDFSLMQLLPENLRVNSTPLPDSSSASPLTAPPVAVPSSETSFVPKPADLLQKQKLDCALQLARSVSLDFNNALTSILGHTSLLLSQMQGDHPWRYSLMEVEKSAARAAEIANDLAAFSRQEKVSRGQVAGNVNSIVQRSVELFQNSTQKIEWAMQLGRKQFAAKFDEAKMQQAFVKIVENAVQAIETSGRIVVQTRNVELREAAQDRDLRLAPGIYVCVEISDNGSGIAPEVLPRIFEPFFTTKKAGTHRGLGLALVYGIVTNHGGGVAVSSQPGNGTSVRIYLPAEKRILPDAAVQTKDLNGTQTILMVDDEDLLLTMGQTVLSAFGYQVLTANSGQKALEIFSKRESPVDLVITDMVMPAMSGRELVEHIRRLAPATRILCTSGFVRPPSQGDGLVYLQKPFTSQDLLIKVKQALAPAGTLVD